MSIGDVGRYDGRRAWRVGERAVVVGGSVAGLVAARVLADAFDEVVVLDRDGFPVDASVRDGAPQTAHPHALLEAGRRTLEDLFPGFGDDLLAAGGLLVDASRDVGHYAEGDFLADGPSRLPMYCASRPLFEHVIRDHVRSLPAVTLRGNCTVTDYLADDDGDVSGVEYRTAESDVTVEENRTAGGSVARTNADLVVDASGRTSRTPQWLDANGYRAPETDAVHVDVEYAAARIDRPAGDRRAFLVPPSPPRTRGAYFIPIEGGQWEVLLQGMHGDTPPTERDAFVAFARTLPVDELGDLVATRAWTSETVHAYPFPSSQRRRYEDLDAFPDGLLVTGDAVASFNPIYGQGMSVAALDAVALHHALADAGTEALASRYFERVGRVVDTVWQLAVGSDFEFDATTGTKPRGTTLFNRYVARLLRKAHDDPVLADAFARVLLLERDPTSLLRPGLVWRTLRPTTGEAADATPTPAAR